MTTPPPIFFRGVPHHAAKHFWEGTQRSCAPAETLARIRPLFPRIGLTRLAPITHLDRIGIPVILAVRPNSAYLSVDAGKGFTAEAAATSAAMECIERYHAEQPRAPDLYLPYEALGEPYQAIPLANLPLTRHSLFHPRRPDRWSLGWDIIGQGEIAAPTAMLLMERHRYSASALIPFQIGSNGLASGNHFLEALCMGLLEVIERDAVTCHQMATYRGHSIPRVRLDTIEAPLVGELLERLARAQVQPLLFDCTVDTKVPTYMAYLYDQQSRHTGIYRGYGAHLDPAIAMLRALTEAVQGRLIYIAGSRDDAFRHTYRRLKQSDAATTLRLLEAAPPTVDARARPTQATPSFEGDIHLLLEKLRRVGLHQAIVFDLTLPGFEAISVVRVIVPGLEGYLLDYYAPGHRARTFQPLPTPFPLPQGAV